MIACAPRRVGRTRPHGGAPGQSSDLEIQVAEVVEMRRRMVDVLSAATGQPRERIVADIDRDYILRGEAAVAYGLIDDVITRAPMAIPTGTPEEPALVL